MFRYDHRDVEEYQKTGVLVREGFLTLNERDEILSHINTFVKKQESTLGTRAIHWATDPSGQRILASLHHLEIDPFFKNFCVSENILLAARTLLHDEPVLMNCQYFGKPAKLGREVPIHQDNAYFHLEPCNALSFWISLDDADRENGCVQYFTGSHLLGDLPHQLSGVPGSSQTLISHGDLADRHPIICANLKIGGIIAHHFLTVHWSKANQSERPRRALVLTFRGNKCHQNEQRHEQYLKDLAKNAV